MIRSTFLFLLITVITFQSNAQRVMENLGRGLVAVRQPGGNVFVSWRLLATEPFDVSFNLYRSTINNKLRKLNRSSITKTTCFTDSTTETGSQYTYVVKKIVKDKEVNAGKSYILKPGAASYLSVPLQTPEGYTANDGSAGDLDGD